MFDVQFARRQMIEQQVRAWEVLDARVLEILQQLPREAYVPPAYRELAFADTEVPIGHGQTMLSPKLEGRILQALDIQPGDRALEVGTGTGFFAACLGQLARSVRTMDLHPDFVAGAPPRPRARAPATPGSARAPTTSRPPCRTRWSSRSGRPTT